MRTQAWIWSAVLVLAVAGVLALGSGQIAVPPDWNPWRPLDVAAKPNWLTRYKLRRLDGNGGLCRDVLRATAMDFEVLADRVTGPACGFHDAVRVRRTPSAIGEEFSLSCRTAVSVALWERHVLQPAANRYFGEQVSRIEHFGSYSCRNVYGRPAATRSRHATAEAWDVAGFVFTDGRRVRVARDWKGYEDPVAAAFLREVRDGACRFFDGVLGPDYNAAHQDHLHLDRGSFRLCR